MADTAQIAAPHGVASPVAPTLPEGGDARALHRLVFLGLALVLIGAPFVFYPVFLMKVLCFGLFALAFNLLLGYGGLLSFGHAAYFGMASYLCAYTAKHLGFTPEVAILAGTATAAFIAATQSPTSRGSRIRQAPNRPSCTRSDGQPTLRLISA